MKRAIRTGAVALLAAAALTAPALVTSTAASWGDGSYARAAVLVAPGDCSATGLFEASASAAQLAGSVQGTAIGAGALAPVPTGVRIAASSVSRPLSVDDVGTSPAVAGTALPVQLTPHATWTQTAATSGTGTSTATAGGGAAVGSVDVSGLLARPPSAAALLPGLTAVLLDVGRVDATARLDGCAVAFGGGPSLTRSSSVSALGLRATDAAAASSLAAMRTSGTGVAADLAAQGATAAPLLATAASGALLTAVQQALTTLGTPGASATAATSTASVVVAPAAITATATGSQRSGAVALDVASGTLTADLSGPVSAGPDADVLSAGTLAASAVSAGTALQQQATALATAEASVRDDAVVAVQPAVDVSVTALGVTAKVATVTLESPATATAAGWTAGTGPAQMPGVKVALLGPLQLNGLKEAVDAVLAPVLRAQLRTAVQDRFTTPATKTVTDAAAAVAGSVTTANGLIRTHLAALQGVLVVTGDQRAGVAADSWTGSAAAGTGQVTALRIRVRDATGTRADLFIGDAAVGPDRPALR